MTAFVNVRLIKLRIDGLFYLMWSFYQAIQDDRLPRLNLNERAKVNCAFLGFLNSLAFMYHGFSVRNWDADEQFKSYAFGMVGLSLVQCLYSITSLLRIVRLCAG